MLVSIVPIRYAEEFGNALRELVPQSQIKMQIDVEVGTFELLVTPDLTLEEFKQWNVIWWGLRQECE
jgi:hypothetical protein